MTHLKGIVSILILLIVSSITGVFAQQGAISGVVTDKTTKDKIPFATVSIVTINGNVSTMGTVTDKNGKFDIDKLIQGNYEVVISFIGYQSDTLRNILIDKPVQQINIGRIELNSIVTALDEISVQGLAKTASNKLDRVTYRASDFEAAKGGTATDVLNRLPSVSVDPDGVVSVRGTSDFMVYLNGKPTQMEPSMLLAQIPANTIESIDIITVPSAKYDAQGKGGIINISTKKTGQKGLSISANGLTGGAPWGNYSDSTSNYRMNDNRLVGGVNIIYVKDKLSLYGGASFNNKNVNGTRPAYARLLQDNGSYYHLTADGARPEWFENYTANAALDYQINKNSTLSASYYYGNRTEGRSAFYNYHTFYGDLNQDPILDVPLNEAWVYNPNTRNRYGIFHTATLDFKQKFDNNSELKISALFEHSKLKREMDNQQYQYIPSTQAIGQLQKHFLQTDNTPLDGLRLSIDYTRKLANGHTLGLGLQPQYCMIAGSFSYDTLDVTSNVWGDYTFFENAIDFRRGIYAGYADYSGSLGKLDFLAGLRLEYTDQVMDMQNPDYFTIFDRVKKPRYEVHKLDWFPSIHLNYKISGNSKITLASSRRINRPPLINMAPFLYREHYEVYVVGDPALEPEYLANLELGFNQKAGKADISLTGFYRGVDNAVFRVNTVYEEENVLIRSYTNSANTRSTGLELTMNGTVGTFARYLLSGSVYRFKVQGDIFGYQENNSSMNWSIKGNANFILTKALKFTIDLDMKSATVTAQGRDALFYMANASLNYTPVQLKGWELSLKGLNILKSNVTRLNTRAYNPTGEQIFYQETEFNRFGPIVEIAASYSFNLTGKSSRKADSAFGKDQF